MKKLITFPEAKLSDQGIARCETCIYCQHVQGDSEAQRQYICKAYPKPLQTFPDNYCGQWTGIESYHEEVDSVCLPGLEKT